MRIGMRSTPDVGRDDGGQAIGVEGLLQEIVGTELDRSWSQSV
jgi:hypothetical protein